MIFNKGTKTIQWRIVFQQMLLEQLTTHEKE